MYSNCAAGIFQLIARSDGGSAAAGLRHGAALMRERGAADIELLSGRGRCIERRVGSRQVKRTIAGDRAVCSVERIGINGQGTCASVFECPVGVGQCIGADVYIDAVARNSTLGVIEVAWQTERHIAIAYLNDLTLYVREVVGGCIDLISRNIGPIGTQCLVRVSGQCLTGCNRGVG